MPMEPIAVAVAREPLATAALLLVCPHEMKLASSHLTTFEQIKKMRLTTSLNRPCCRKYVYRRRGRAVDLPAAYPSLPAPKAAGSRR
jgi:hypothetical protein